MLVWFSQIKKNENTIHTGNVCKASTLKAQKKTQSHSIEKKMYEAVRFYHKNDFKRIVNTIYFSIMTTNLSDEMCKMLFFLCHKIESI